MRLYELVFAWLWVIIVVPLCFYIVVVYWGPVWVSGTVSSPAGEVESPPHPGTWVALLTMKGIATVMLGAALLIVDGIIGISLPNTVLRLAVSTIEVAFGVGFVLLGISIVKNHHALVGDDHDPPGEGDVVSDVLSRGPGSALRSHVVNTVYAILWRLPLGWVVPALVAIAVGLSTCVAAVLVWTDGKMSTISLGPVAPISDAFSGALSVGDAAVSLGDTIFFYALWSLVVALCCVAALRASVHHRVAKACEWMGGAIVAAAPLVVAWWPG